MKTEFKNKKGLTLIELAIILAIAAIIAAVVAVVILQKPKSGSESTPKGGVKTTVSPKITENEGPRAQQDRLFYDVNYFGGVNKINLDFKLTANDAGKKINGLSIDLAAQDPALPNPVTSSIFANGGGLSSGSNWDCTITGTTFSCNGKETLELNKQSSFEFSFASLKNCPEKLTINLLENGAIATTIMPLLQK